METRQKVCAIAVFLLFLFGAGAAEAENWSIALVCLIMATSCTVIGGLDKKKTNIKNIMKDWRIHEWKPNQETSSIVGLTKTKSQKLK